MERATTPLSRRASKSAGTDIHYTNMGEKLGAGVSKALRHQDIGQQVQFHSAERRAPWEAQVTKTDIIFALAVSNSAIIALLTYWVHTIQKAFMDLCNEVDNLKNLLHYRGMI